MNHDVNRLLRQAFKNKSKNIARQTPTTEEESSIVFFGLEILGQKFSTKNRQRNLNQRAPPEISG